MKSVRVIYKLRIVEDVPVGDYSEWSAGVPPTLEQIRTWEAENLKQLMTSTEQSLGGQVTGTVLVEELT